MKASRFRLALVLLLLIGFILSACAASPVYTLAQLHATERAQQDLRGQRVELHYQDGRMMTGYFYEASADSIRLYRKRNQQAPFAVPAYEIRMIRVLASPETDLVVAGLVLGAAALVFVIAQSYGAAFSSQN